MKSQEEQELRVQVEQVRGRLQGLETDLRVVDDEVEGLAPQQTHYELLGRACGSLERLGELGAASLFWGDQIEPARVDEQLREVRGRVSAFEAQIGALEQKRQEILTEIGREEEILEILGEDIYHIRQEEERRKLEWVIERDIGPLPRRAQLMAWARGGEEDRRFRKSLATSMLISLLLGALLPMIHLPVPERFRPDDATPKRLAQLVRQAQAKPIPPPPLVAEKPPEQTPPEEPKPEPVEEPKPSEQPPETPAVAAAETQPQSDQPGAPGPPAETPGVARQAVAKAGILAFRDEFASLARDKVAPRLGADARLGDADDVSKPSMPSRSMLTTNAPGSSGGINLASLSRNVGGGGGGGGAGGGGGLQGVQVGRATSSIASIGGGGRPLARGGPGPSRTDEEIQIVFDRYKAAFYRLYNRELRKDPTLQGQMVLRLTIEPDGSVSMCKLQSTDMNAPTLAAQVLNRVLTINFGAKDVEALTIVYPIDFLPAT